MFFVSAGSYLFVLVSNATFPHGADWKTPNAAPLFFIIIVVYAEWRVIIRREPPTQDVFRRRHSRLILLTAGLLGAMCVAGVLGGIWNGHNREKVHKFDELMSAATSLGETGTRISSIKDRDHKTTKDYIEAYTQIDSLLPEWKKKFGTVSAMLAEVRAYDLDARTSSILVLDSAAFDLTREGIALTEKEVTVIEQMSKLPPGKQVPLWVARFQPLQDEEARLRQKMDDLQRKLSALSNAPSSRPK
jgi:hypothetical protein